MKDDLSRFQFSFQNEWRQLLGKHNWYNLTPIEISFENDIMYPGYEFRFVVLGLGFWMRINRSWEGTALEESINKATKKAKK